MPSSNRSMALTGITAISCGDEIVGGKVVLSPMELLPLFRRCGTGPTEGIMRRIQMLNRQDWLLITDPAGGIVVAVADMMIAAVEVHGFEEENDMGRRVAAGPGVSTSYDWEGMNIALIVRIFDQGLPDTERDDQAPDVPLILAVDVASREGPELAPDNQERLDSDAATERVLPGLVTGNIFHHVAEATENCRDQAVLTLILVTSACPLLARTNGRSNRIFMNSIA